MKNFIEQISIKFGGFFVNYDEFGTNCAVDKHIKILIGENLYIGRYSKGQIS